MTRGRRATGASTGTSSDTADSRRWWILAVLAIAQLMVVLDATVVNIALPSAQHALHITDANRQWIVTAYTLTFGGLLLLGGRIADYFGRRRAFLIGLLGFAAASAIGGAAVNAGTLFAARALQGVFGALLAPAALSLLTVTFTAPKSGPSGRFTRAKKHSSRTVRVKTNSNGIALAPPFTANVDAGGYAVVVATGSVRAAVSLLNLPRG